MLAVGTARNEGSTTGGERHGGMGGRRLRRYLLGVRLTARPASLMNSGSTAKISSIVLPWQCNRWSRSPAHPAWYHHTTDTLRCVKKKIKAGRGRGREPQASCAMKEGRNNRWGNKAARPCEASLCARKRRQAALKACLSCVMDASVHAPRAPGPGARRGPWSAASPILPCT